MLDQEIEKQVQVKGLNAPRVSLAALEAQIEHVEIVKHVTPSGQILRWAVLTTKNGFAVTGKPSAAVSSKNDDAEIGEKVAIENAKSELWPLMGYALKDRLFQYSAIASEIEAEVFEAHVEPVLNRLLGA